MRLPALITFLLAAPAAILSCRTEPGSGPKPGGVTGGGDSRDSAAAAIPGGGPENARGILHRYRLGSAPDRILTLPSSLREISGIAFTGDGRLFAHDDERGTVCRIDTSTGEILGRFGVGEKTLREDLEDIAIDGESFWLVNSSGRLYRFAEGRDGESVPYAGFAAGLGPRNEVEGLCLDPATRTLLLACKSDPGVSSGDVRAVYTFDLRTLAPAAAPRFLIDLRRLQERFGEKVFRPSAIGRHPSSGNFFILSSVGNSIVELSPGGEVLSHAPLPGKYNAQPEGIAFDRNGRLFIANEGDRKGKIAVYGYGSE